MADNERGPQGIIAETLRKTGIVDDAGDSWLAEDIARAVLSALEEAGYEVKKTYVQLVHEERARRRALFEEEKK